MSFSLSIELATLPPPSTVFAALASHAVQCSEAPDGLERWPAPPAILHLHAVGKSVRGVELILERGEVRLRMMSMANQADWQLAVDLIRALAPRPDTRVVGEDGTEATVATVTRFNDVIVREIAMALATVMQIGQGEFLSLQLEGAVRSVHLGPRVRAELDVPEPVKAFVGILERARRIQYIEHEGFAFQTAQDVGAMLGIPLSIEMAIWDPREPQAFGPTPTLGASFEDGNLYVPVDALPAVLGPRFEWLDDKQFLIQPTPASGLSALRARCEAIAIDPWAQVKQLAATRKKSKWKFWKRS